MLVKKEISTLVFALAASLVILSSYQFLPDGDENFQPAEDIDCNEGISSKNAFLSEEKMPENREYEIQPTKSDFQQDKDNWRETENNQSFSWDGAGTEEGLSLEDILSEIENLSSDLKLEFEEKESCSGCSQSDGSSPSICSTILSSAGVSGCTCANTMGVCCAGDPDHCSCSNHPCCCVCCDDCCR